MRAAIFEGTCHTPRRIILIHLRRARHWTTLPTGPAEVSSEALSWMEDGGNGLGPTRSRRVQSITPPPAHRRNASASLLYALLVYLQWCGEQKETVFLFRCLHPLHHKVLESKRLRVVSTMEASASQLVSRKLSVSHVAIELFYSSYHTLVVMVDRLIPRLAWCLFPATGYRYTSRKTPNPRSPLSKQENETHPYISHAG